MKNHRLLETALMVIAITLLLVILGPVQPSRAEGDGSREGSFMVAIQSCGPIPQCGNITTYSQQTDPVTRRVVSVPRTYCTCCMIAECGARIRAWRDGNWGSRWRAPAGCAFGSCPPRADVYYFAPETPK